MDFFIDRERKRALETLLKAALPSVQVAHVASVFAYPSTAAFQEQIPEFNLVLDASGKSILCKESLESIAAAAEAAAANGGKPPSKTRPVFTPITLSSGLSLGSLAAANEEQPPSKRKRGKGKKN